MEIQKLSSQISATAIKDEDKLTRKELLDQVAHYFEDDEKLLFTAYVPNNWSKKILFLTNLQLLLYSELEGKYQKKLRINSLKSIEIKHSFTEHYKFIGDDHKLQFSLSDKESINKLNSKLRSNFIDLLVEKKSLFRKLVKYLLILWLILIIFNALKMTTDFVSCKIQQTSYKSQPVSVDELKYHANKITQDTAPQTTKLKVIPGLTPGDIYLHYTKRGFDKSGPRKIADDVPTPNAGKYSWYLSKTDDSNFCTYDLTIYSPDGLSMDQILASLVCPNSTSLIPTAANFLPFVASIDYEGSNITTAVTWIENNLSKQQAETNIGGINFRLKQDGPKSIYLYIEP